MRSVAAGLLAALAGLAFSTSANAFKEIEVQKRYCADMVINHQLKDGSEVDCYNGDVAIEVDFSDHWAQAIGQALHYASLMERRPAIILVCNQTVKAKTCAGHRSRLVETVKYWNIGMYLWYCDSRTDKALKDCVFEDLWGPE